jgi:hypothetical protein
MMTAPPSPDLCPSHASTPVPPSAPESLTPLTVFAKEGVPISDADPDISALLDGVRVRVSSDERGAA